MKKIIKLFCVVSCLLVCFTGCGKEEEKINYNAEQMRAYMEAQIGYVGNIIENPAADDGYVTDSDVLKSAEKSWGELKEDCGEFVLSNSVSDFKIDEATDELDVTEKLKFEKRSVVVSAVFEEKDDVMTMTSLSFEPEYSLGEKLEQAGINTIVGMATVFVILIFISLVISLFKFIPQITEALENRKNKKETATEIKEVQTENVQTVEESQTTDDTELIAVIAAAIAASENTTTDGFVVRSIRKR